MFYTLYYTTICFLRNALRMFCKLAQLSQKGKMLFPFLTVFAVLLFTFDFASAEQDPYLSPKECVDRTVALPGDTSLDWFMSNRVPAFWERLKPKRKDRSMKKTLTVSP